MMENNITLEFSKEIIDLKDMDKQIFINSDNKKIDVSNWTYNDWKLSFAICFPNNKDYVNFEIEKINNARESKFDWNKLTFKEIRE